MVNKKRHLAKTVSYRIISTTIGFVTVWVFTGSLEIGSTFTIMELLWKPVQYYIHERVWYNYIKYGIDKKDKS